MQKVKQTEKLNDCIKKKNNIYKYVGFNKEYKKTNIFIKFLFPMFPIKLMSSVYLMVFMASLIGIRLILSQFSIPIIPFGFNISFAWLPLYICGFFFGPVIGLFFGIALDSLTFVINGGIWFWMYAIQEPIIGVVSGCIGSCFLLNLIKSIKIQSIIQQLFIIGFTVASIFIIVYQFFIIEGKIQSGGLTNVTTFAIISTIIMVLYLCINEIQFLYFKKKNKTIKQTQFLSIYLHVSMLVIIVTIMFSFMLGPISFVEYSKYITGSTPNNFIKYGSMYYLVPRVLKEAIKTPIYILLLFGIISAIKGPLARFICINKNSW